MFTIGQDLYRLTQRDEETLLVDPYMRTLSQNIPALSSGADVLFSDIPVDRSLYLHSVNFDINPGAAQTVAQVIVWIRSRDAVLEHALNLARGVICGDNQGGAAVAGTSIGLTRNIGLVIPPGCILGARVVKSSAANAGDYAARVTGYLIPPGRIGRAF